MDCTITQESFDSLASFWTDPSLHLQWDSVFVLPAWLKVWWQEFGPEAEPYLGTVRQGDKIIGIAPLFLKEKTASIIGSTDVCDYLDFVIVPGMETEFFGTLLDDLRQRGINQLDMQALRPGSTVLTNLVGIAEQLEYQVLSHPEDTSVELDLPASWEEYLAALTKKQRHEVRRKLRRLAETDKANYRFIEVKQPVGDFMDTFLKLFSMGHEEKANFMTARMESFFRSLAEAMAELGLLRFGILELDKIPAAMIMCFYYNDVIYLYNSAYDPRYNSLSVGLLCKVLGIKESIEKGRQKWDFLKGNEPYKYHLGGREVPLYRCQVTIK